MAVQDWVIQNGCNDGRLHRNQWPILRIVGNGLHLFIALLSGPPGERQYISSASLSPLIVASHQRLCTSLRQAFTLAAGAALSVLGSRLAIPDTGLSVPAWQAWSGSEHVPPEPQSGQCSDGKRFWHAKHRVFLPEKFACFDQPQSKRAPQQSLRQLGACQDLTKRVEPCKAQRPALINPTVWPPRDHGYFRPITHLIGKSP